MYIEVYFKEGIGSLTQLKFKSKNVQTYGKIHEQFIFNEINEFDINIRNFNQTRI